MIAPEPVDPPRWWSRLILDEALVMTGAQFREVALPLLMVALWRGSQSYALALFAVYLPSVALARWAGRVADSVEPKRLILISYAIRVLGVAVLLLARQLPVAIGAVTLLGVGTAINAPALTHYQASATAHLNQLLVSRLRLVDSVSQGLVPILAGGLIAAGGRELGFLVSLGCYAAALAVMAGLPAVGTAGVHTGDAPRVRARIPRPVLAQMTVGGVIAALSWMANVLYTAYILVTLHAGALRYGVALGVWGGAGLLSAALLPRLNPGRPERWIAALILVLGAAWAVMTLPVGYWVVAGLGLPEGFATFLLVDLIQSRILTEAGPRERGQWQADNGAWNAGGRMTGLAAASAVPWLLRVHLTFGGLAFLAGTLALFWRLRSSRRHPGQPAS
jgi:MFS family permease